MSNSSLASGMIVGGTDNGGVYMYDAAKLLQGSEALLGQLEKVGAFPPLFNYNDYFVFLSGQDFLLVRIVLYWWLMRNCWLRSLVQFKFLSILTLLKFLLSEMCPSKWFLAAYSSSIFNQGKTFAGQQSQVTDLRYPPASECSEGYQPKRPKHNFISECLNTKTHPSPVIALGFIVNSRSVPYHWTSRPYHWDPRQPLDLGVFCIQVVTNIIAPKNNLMTKVSIHRNSVWRRTRALEPQCGRRPCTCDFTLAQAYNTHLHFITQCWNNFFFHL